MQMLECFGRLNFVPNQKDYKSKLGGAKIEEVPVQGCNEIFSSSKVFVMKKKEGVWRRGEARLLCSTQKEVAIPSKKKSPSKDAVGVGGFSPTPPPTVGRSIIENCVFARFSLSRIRALSCLFRYWCRREENQNFSRLLPWRHPRQHQE